MTGPAAPDEAVRKPAPVRRAEIIDAAIVEFAETGLAGTRLEVIAARAGISHPRVIQMFGSKRARFLAVVDKTFDRIIEALGEVASAGERSDLAALGDAYRRLLRRDRSLGLVMLQGYAAAADEVVRELVSRRYLALQHTVAEFAGADPLAGAHFLRDWPDRHRLDGTRASRSAPGRDLGCLAA